MIPRSAVINRPVLAYILLCLSACSGENGGTEVPPGAADLLPNESQVVTPSELSIPEAAGSVSDATASESFVLGRNYNRLTPTQPTSSGPDRVEVAEIFSYRSRESFELDMRLRAWEARKPAYIRLRRIPFISTPLERLHARAFFAAEELGRSDEIHRALFDAIQSQGISLDSVDRMRDFFLRLDIDPESFQDAFDSFIVHSKLQRAEQLSRRYRVMTVPTIVINGKYTTTPSMSGGSEVLLTLVEYLARQEILAG